MKGHRCWKTESWFVINTWHSCSHLASLSFVVKVSTSWSIKCVASWLFRNAKYKTELIAFCCQIHGLEKIQVKNNLIYSIRVDLIFHNWDIFSTIHPTKTDQHKNQKLLLTIPNVFFVCTLAFFLYTQKLLQIS